MSEHLYHLLLPALILGLFLFSTLRNRILLFSTIHIIVLFTLTLFALTHIIPLKSIHYSHDQSQSVTEHTCCIPQTIDTPALSLLALLSKPSVLFPHPDRQKTVKQLISLKQNKSPPSHS